jgi:hypothetical protein
MAYKVVSKFKDLKDDLYLYREGDTFPRKGKRPTKARKEELESKGFIKEVE